MSNEDEKKTGLVPSQSIALSRAGATSLVRRGVQDLVAKAEAEQWYRQGVCLWRQQQYGEAVECFRRGLQLDPNHADLQFFLGVAYYRRDGVPKQDFTQTAIWWRKAAEQGHEGCRMPSRRLLLGRPRSSARLRKSIWLVAQCRRAG